MRKKTAAILTTACVWSIVLAFSWACAAQISPEKTAQLNADIESVKAQIQEAEAEDAKYSGGLIKSLIAMRLETLRNTLAMLDQREKSWAHGIAVKYTVGGDVYSPPPDKDQRLATINEELKTTETKIEAHKAKASRYSGGLVLAMTLSTLATTEQSYAMLDQRRLGLQYDIPQYSLKAPAVATTASQVESVDTPTEKDWEIVDVDAKVTESNSSWSKFAWKLTIKNKASHPQAFDATIEFQDKDGFVVDDDNEYGLVVPANAEKTFTGYDLVDAAIAGNVSKIAAKAGKK